MIVLVRAFSVILKTGGSFAALLICLNNMCIFILSTKYYSSNVHLVLKQGLVDNNVDMPTITEETSIEHVNASLNCGGNNVSNLLTASPDTQ